MIELQEPLAVLLQNETQAPQGRASNSSPAESATDGETEQKSGEVSIRLPRPDDLPEGPPGDLWDKLLKASKPSAAAVRTRVLTLNEAGRHDHVIALVRAALVNGQSQPWMYEVLALSMEIEGYPKEDIERVVLSMSDFGAANYDSLLQSSRYLQAFSRPVAALALLRQASELDPDRAEAYVAALPILQRTLNEEHATWALTGAVETLWGDGTQRARQTAESLGRQIARKLQRDGQEEQASKLLEAVKLAGIPDVKVTLTWNGECDLDLMITEPGGSRCTHQSPRTVAGGNLFEDGFGPAKPIEEYVCARGVSGSYLIDVKRSAGEPAGNLCRVTIAVRTPDGQVETLKQSIPISRDKPTEPIRIELQQGRRTAPQQVLELFQEDERPRRIQVGQADAPQRPGDINRAGAAAFVPQVGVVSEGATLDVLPIVSPDRRYIRMNIRPWFGSITDIQTVRVPAGP